MLPESREVHGVGIPNVGGNRLIHIDGRGGYQNFLLDEEGRRIAGISLELYPEAEMPDLALILERLEQSLCASTEK